MIPLENFVVINMDWRPDRLKLFKAEMARLGISHYTRWNGPAGKDLPAKVVLGLTERIRNAYPDQKSWRAIVGCVLSHTQIIQHAKQQGWDRVFVMEDDVKFHPHFWDQWRKHSALVPDDWKCLSLASWFSSDSTRTKIRGDWYRLERGNLWHTMGYLATQAVYDDLIAAWTPPIEQVDYAWWPIKTPGWYALRPPIISMHVTMSDMHFRRHKFPIARVADTWEGL